MFVLKCGNRNQEDSRASTSTGACQQSALKAAFSSLIAEQLRAMQSKSVPRGATCVLHTGHSFGQRKRFDRGYLTGEA